MRGYLKIAAISDNFNYYFIFILATKWAKMKKILIGLFN